MRFLAGYFLTWAQLEKFSETQRQAFSKVGEQVPGGLKVTPKDYHRIKGRNPLVSATQAAVNWAASGFAVVSPEEAAKRLATCERCEHWGAGVLGVMRCGLCKCTRLKHQLATERCPAGKW